MIIDIHIPSVFQGMDISDAAVSLSLHAGIIGYLLGMQGIRASDAKPYREAPVYGISVTIDGVDDLTVDRAENIIRGAGYTVL